MRILGLDLGEKRVGVALSDETGTIARGKCFIDRKDDKSFISEIVNIADREKAEKIIVGYPLNMDGSSGPRAKDSELIAGKLREITSKEIILWDERLSSVEAENIMLEADMSRRKRKKNIDKLAAQLILQGYLDSVGDRA